MNKSRAARAPASAPLALLALLALLAVGARAQEGKFFGRFEGKLLASTSRGISIIDSRGNFEWSHRVGKLHGCQMLANGNVLVADGDVKEINPKTNEIVFHYAPKDKKGGGAMDCQRLAGGNTMVAENSTGRILELDPRGKIVLEFTVDPCSPGSHWNMRNARKLASGNYLVGQTNKKLTREYSPKGEVVWEVKSNAFSFIGLRLANGNTLVSDKDRITEYTPAGKSVWEFRKTDLPELTIGWITALQVLPNGNIVMGTYRPDMSEERGVAYMEITRDKKLVWRFIEVGRKGSNYMTFQKLGADGKPL
jgi:outer membrane protein assembly factor BamB